MTDFSDIINFFYAIEADIFDVVEKHKIYSGGEYLSAFSKNVTDFSFNHVVPIGRANVRDVMVATAGEFDALGREPVVCVTPLSCEYDSGLNSNLQLFNTDAWMIFDGKKPNTDIAFPGVDVRVATTDDMDDYIDVYFNGFSDGVYADMEPGYAVTERKSFSNPYKTKLMAFYGEKPVGVVSVDVKGDIAYIESFAILRQYRFGGKMARVLGNAAVEMCYAKGASKIFLITAAGTALERFYQSFGFLTKFYGYFYKKGD